MDRLTAVARRSFPVLLGLAGLVCVQLRADDSTEEFLRWSVASQTFEARLDGTPLSETLDLLASATHWQIHFEPEAEHKTRADFRGAKIGEALRRLLAPLNFAYVPGGPGPVKLLVFSTAASEATELVSLKEAAVPKNPKRIENELIIKVPEGSDLDVEALAEKLGAKVIGQISALGAYRLKFDSASEALAARRRLAQEGVGGVMDNYRVDHPGLGGSSARRGPLDYSLRPSADGEEVIVAVIDTQVQTEGTAVKDFLLPTINVTGQLTPPIDTLSHGTSMASTVLNSLAASSGASGETPLRILPVDVYGPNPSTSSFAIAQGIHSALMAGADIINLSLGGDGGSPLVHEVIAAGRASGAVFLAAAGNEPLATPTYPAAHPEVIAVTALDRSGEVASYANYGDFVDVGAPGLSVVPWQGRPYYVVGTSTATAYVSGQAASLAANNGLRGAELEAALRQGVAPTPAATAP